MRKVKGEYPKSGLLEWGGRTEEGMRETERVLLEDLKQCLHLCLTQEYKNRDDSGQKQGNTGINMRVTL